MIDLCTIRSHLDAAGRKTLDAEMLRHTQSLLICAFHGQEAVVEECETFLRRVEHLIGSSTVVRGRSHH